jgi:hypothetical protein
LIILTKPLLPREVDSPAAAVMESLLFETGKVGLARRSGVSGDRPGS